MSEFHKAQLELVRRLQAGESVEEVAAWVAALPANPGIALSHAIEDVAEPDSVAAAIFDALCNL